MGGKRPEIEAVGAEEGARETKLGDRAISFSERGFLNSLPLSSGESLGFFDRSIVIS
jgi:hypothetical protein